MSKQSPIRTCLGSNQEYPKRELWRFVKGPDNLVWFDISGKAHGRGAYVAPDAKLIAAAIKRKAFSRKLDGAQTPPDLAQRVQSALTTQLIAQLGLAKKASALVSGGQKVLEVRQFGALDTVILATDAGDDVATKVKTHADACVWQGLSKVQLEHASGQANVPVLAVQDNAAIAALVAQLKTFETEND